MKLALVMIVALAAALPSLANIPSQELDWVGGRKHTDTQVVLKLPDMKLGGVPTPMKALSIDLARDRDTWRLAGKPDGSLKFILSEMTVGGESVDNWSEISTHIIVFDAPLNAYVTGWVKSLEVAGAEIVEKRELPDGSWWVEYTSSNENGRWRFLRGPDGVYGVSYQTKPESENQDVVNIWDGILKDAHLIDNPLRPDSR